MSIALPWEPRWWSWSFSFETCCYCRWGFLFWGYVFLSLFLFHMLIMIDWEVLGIWIVPVPLAIFCSFWEASLYYWWLASFHHFTNTYWAWELIYIYIFNLMLCPLLGILKTESALLEWALTLGVWVNEQVWAIYKGLLCLVRFAKRPP